MQVIILVISKTLEILLYKEVKHNGTNTEYITTNTELVFVTEQALMEIGSITNISVKEVGQNWELGTGWSIGKIMLLLPMVLLIVDFIKMPLQQ